MEKLMEGGPFLDPIEVPKSWMMKLVYYLTRLQLGKVVTPVKVYSARMPVAFGLFAAKIQRLDKKLQLPLELQLLIRHQVSRLNVCLFCIDISRYHAIRASIDTAKFDALDHYRTNPLYSEAERAALDYVTELTKDKKVSPETFARLSQHYSERAICEIIWLVTTEHVYTLANIGLNVHSDMLCDITKGGPKPTGKGHQDEGASLGYDVAA